MRIASLGHGLFAATMIALGVLSLIKGDFAPIWNSVPKNLPAREGLAYLSALVALVGGVGLLWRKAAAIAARVLLVFLLLWLLLIKVRLILLSPTVEVTYQSSGETAVYVAGAWVLYAWFASDWDKRNFGFATGENGVRIARVLYGLSLIAFGLSHFFYVKQTVPLVPGWMGVPVFWAHFTGCTYFAAGVAILIGVCARLAAALSTLQMGLFLLLIWMPVIQAGNTSDFQLSEAIVTWALTAASWVVMDSYRGMRWLAVNKR